MLAREALETIRKRLEAVRVSHKALEALLKLQPILEALEPTQADSLDICISLASPVGDDLKLPRSQWQLVSRSKVKQDRAETEELLEPYRARLAAIATSPVIHYGNLKRLLAELSTAVRGIKPNPDLQISLYQAFGDLEDREYLATEQWEAEIEAQAALEP